MSFKIKTVVPYAYTSHKCLTEIQTEVLYELDDSISQSEILKLKYDLKPERGKY